MSEEVEDVATIVRERDGLRTRVRKLEAEVAHLRAIIISSGERVRLKPDDTRGHSPRQRQSTRA